MIHCHVVNDTVHSLTVVNHNLVKGLETARNCFSTRRSKSGLSDLDIKDLDAFAVETEDSIPVFK